MSVQIIDGAHGEGGGQILRTAVAAAALTGRPIRIEKIRAGRRNPGLAAQHLVAVRASAALCGARISGDSLGSRTLEFSPAGPPRAGTYSFDVGAAREGGSAGAVTLVLHAILMPLALADGPSTCVLRGGTHTAWSPPFDYVRDVWLPALRGMGVRARAELLRWGWYPSGGGAVRVTIEGTVPPVGRPGPLVCRERGPLLKVVGRAAATRVPRNVAERMADRARALLAAAGIEADIVAETPDASCAGAGVFLVAEYAGIRAGFSALGARGKPAESVAEEAARALLEHRFSESSLEAHLADQILLPAALASGPSEFTVARVSRHLLTNAWVIGQFGLADVRVEGEEDRPGLVTVSPR